MKLLFATAMLAVLVPQPVQILTQNHGISVTPTGIVRVDPWTCYPLGSGGPAPTMTEVRRLEQLCPKRIEISAEVDDKVSVCRTTASGQTCRTLAEMFPTSTNQRKD